MKVYHGTSLVVASPLCHVGRDNLDFGKGFYVTPLLDQARSWAQSVSRKRNADPVVNIYEFDKDGYLSEAKYKSFPCYDTEWLDFVVRCRNLDPIANKYDYIDGGVANDNVIDTVRLYALGLMDLETALRRLSYHKPNHQIYLKNQILLLKYLKFEGID